MNDYLESRIDYLQWDNDRLREENEKLKERIKELEQCNLSLQTWIDKKERVNESLRKELDFYRKQYEHTMWEDKLDLNIWI